LTPVLQTKEYIFADRLHTFMNIPLCHSLVRSVLYATFTEAQMEAVLVNTR